MITGFGSSLGVICVMILIQSCSADQILINIPQLKHALNRDAQVEPTRPTWDLTRKAAREFDSLNQEGRKYFMKFTENQLVHDSVLLPFMKHAREVPNKDVAELFLDTLFATYKYFMPLYLSNQKITEEIHRMPATKFLHDVLSGQHDRKSVTESEFNRAMAELINLRNQSEKIIDLGLLPYKRVTMGAYYNSSLENRAFVAGLVEANTKGVTTMHGILKIFKRQIKEEKRRRKAEESRLRRNRAENNPNPNEEAGPSGQS